MSRSSIRQYLGVAAMASMTGAAVAAPAPGTVIRDCQECPPVVVVPSGTFTMGSVEGEVGRDEDEGPARTVTIGTAFAIGQYEVTFTEWDACVSAGACERVEDDGWPSL